MRSLISAFFKGLAIGYFIGWVITVAIQLMISLGAVKTFITIGITACVWRYRVRIAQLFIIAPICALLRVYRWVMAPVLFVNRITHVK